MYDEENSTPSADESAQEVEHGARYEESDQDVVADSDGSYSASSRTKYLLLGIIVVLVAVLAYGITQTSASAGDQDAGDVATAQGGAQGAGECGGGACADCETGGEAAGGPIVASTFLEDDHQWIDVNASGEYFDPNVIVAAAGTPIKINFGQGTGCMTEVMFYDFPVQEDLTSGGAIVDLPALEPGEYAFACGAEAVFGMLIVQ